MITLTQGLGIAAFAIVATIVTVSRLQVRQAERERDDALQVARELRGAITKQNGKVEAWEAAASAARADSLKAQGLAASAAGELTAEAKRLRTIKPATCDDAVKRVREGLGK